MSNTDDLKQKMRDNNPASVEKKILIGTIDVTISLGLTFFVGNYLLPNRIWNNWTDTNPLIVLIVGYLLCRILAIITIDKTVGMIISKTKFLNKNYEEPNLVEKLFGAVFIPYNETKLFDKYPLFR
jgi:hypothetical protein